MKISDTAFFKTTPPILKSEPSPPSSPLTSIFYFENFEISTHPNYALAF